LKQSGKDGKIIENYVFGEFIESPRALSPGELEVICERGHAIKRSLMDYPVKKIIDLLARTGDLWKDRSYSRRREALERMPALTGFHESMVERALDAMAALLDHENLERKLTCELGTKDYLDGWVFHGPAGAMVRARPLGTVLHVSAGNVFVGAIDSLISGILTKNVNLLKFASGDPLFPLLFARSLQEMDREGIISTSFCLLSFRSRDSAVEGLLKRSCDAIVVWGGEEAVAAYRKDLPRSTRLIEYGPRFSLSLITEEGLRISGIDRACKSLALDSVMWEQRACSSPQILFFKCPAGSLLPADLIAGLEKAMKAIARELPQGELSMDEEIELLKARELATMAMLCGEGSIIFPLGRTDYTIIESRSATPILSPLNRCIIIKPFSAWSEFFSSIEAVSSSLQTLSFMGSPAELEEISSGLLSLGLLRITEVGKSHEVMTGAPHDGTYQLQNLISWAALESPALLGRTPSSSLEVDGEKLSSLDHILTYACAHSPYYRRFSRKGAPVSLEDFPFLTRHEIYRHTPPAGIDLLTGSLENAYVFASGGSTGAPKFCYYTVQEFDHVADILAEIYRIAGIRPSDRVANLFYAGSLWTSFLAATKALERLGCTNLPIAGNSEQEFIQRYISLFRPEALIGSPSVIIQMAEEWERRGGGALNISTILYGGEHVTGDVEAYLKKTLGASIIRSAGYALVDAGPVGFQCASCRGSIHHLLENYQHLEIVDDDEGPFDEIPRGGAGEIIVTNLHRKLMPIIRYRTGDKGRWVHHQCPCGRKERLFELLGRCDDALRVGNMCIYPDEIESHITSCEGLSRIFQIMATRKEKKDHITVRIEARSPECLENTTLAEDMRASIVKLNPELDLVLKEAWVGSFTVEIVPSGTIERVKRTGKIIKVKDMREHHHV
jgi:phenylacetate-CoA ligase